MGLAIVHSRASYGTHAPPVTIEVHLASGLPKLNIVGLPETAVKESKDRVKSALQNSRFEFPMRRITVNLAPADLPKEGGRFDLPIAIGILAASKQLPRKCLNDYEFAGELALSGELRPIKGVLPFAIATEQQGRSLIIPTTNGNEASLAAETPIYTAKHLLDVCAHLTQRKALSAYQPSASSPSSFSYPDLAEVQGQTLAKRALEIAAAGRHSLLFTGPPGTGKTMLASRLPGILPTMSTDEALEVASLYSISRQGFEAKHWKKRPFRSPHHTTSSAALVGGGSSPQPGEISLAHHGILFLDELPEFNRNVLEALREPLEAGHITISRAAQHAQFPARFQLIAAMNPCPCGHLGNPKQHCRCSAEQVQRYQAKISGPLLDRIDIHLRVAPLPINYLMASSQQNTNQETSQQVQQRVMQAHNRQIQRASVSNAALNNKQLAAHCQLGKTQQQFLEQAMTNFNLSARAYHRILKLARTIADLDAVDLIAKEHLQEALSYRQLERANQN